MTDAFSGIVARSMGAIDKKIDYLGADGFWHCGRCGKAKQKYIHCLDRDWLVGFVCECQPDNDKAKQAEREKKIKERLHDCFGDSKAHSAPDDDAQSRRTGACKKYAETFTKQSRWLVLFGDVGTGKSYRAAQICKDVIKRDFTAKFTTLGEIERELWDNDKVEVYRNLERYDLLVLDDFGAERQTQYTAEIRYNVIDMRYNSGKPLIITTNIKKFDSDDLADKRVYSRIKEKSLFIRYEGEDRRNGTKPLDKAEIEKLLTEDGWEDL